MPDHVHLDAQDDRQTTCWHPLVAQGRSTIEQRQVLAPYTDAIRDLRLIFRAVYHVSWVVDSVSSSFVDRLLTSLKSSVGLPQYIACSYLT